MVLSYSTEIVTITTLLTKVIKSQTSCCCIVPPTMIYSNSQFHLVILSFLSPLKYIEYASY